MLRIRPSRAWGGSTSNNSKEADPSTRDVADADANVEHQHRCPRSPITGNTYRSRAHFDPSEAPDRARREDPSLVVLPDDEFDSPSLADSFNQEPDPNNFFAYVKPYAGKDDYLIPVS